MARVEDRAVERAVRVAKERARDDVQVLVAAGRKLLHRDGAADMTIADVLTEAGLSTRAFYRHFASKSDLLLAIYDNEVDRYTPRLQRRLDAATTARAGLEAWIDELLAAGFEPRRGERTRAMFTWAIPLQQEFPVEFAAVRDALTGPLEAVLEAGRADGSFPNAEPRRHAQFIRALTWQLVEERLSGAAIDVAEARDEVLRFCLPALGAAR
ncbi:MAG: TetR family transcriptional regulator [Actinomycetia bacterium]|nr:TetR family transcriptional regulator [Actinomycetes bacterium]